MRNLAVMTLVVYLAELSQCQDIIVSFTPETAVLYPGGNVTFTCNITIGRFWLVNDTTTRKSSTELPDGVLADGNMFIVTESANNTLYGCGVIVDPDVFIDTGIVYLAGAPEDVFGVMVVTESITLSDFTNLTLMLTWGEPFNNFDPIINYTISCTGDPSCPQDIITPDNTTRYTITNLRPEANYTFTVVATNSLGSGNAGTLTFTSPSIPGEVTGATLTCKPAATSNNCTAMWNPVIMGNGPLEQPLVYRVYYNGTTRDVDNITTSLTFPFSPLPVGIYRDNIHLIVTAANRFGSGISSNTAPATVYGSSVTSVSRTASNRTNGNVYSATFNCTIHPDSDVEFCSVMLAARENLGPVRDGQAEVIVTGLQCGVRYNITAEGRMSTSQAFVGFAFASTTTLPCAAGGAGGAVISNAMMMIVAITIIMMCM
ncbi:receptor-type tyrosine-protein phosphatase S-like isoform X2 [Dysidea avara]|uniref:receptor-type tyrosine-protein phosphatase S-like isoform X2 n=1 Tax=Dysidea avara TaxID=196820 RepID=UPI00331AAD0F